MSPRDIPVTAGEEQAGGKCPVCGQPVQKGDRCVICPRCRTAHHLSCWRRNGGCGSLGCPQTAESEVTRPENTGNNEERHGDSNAPLVIGITAICVVLIGILIWGVFFRRPDEAFQIRVMLPHNYTELVALDKLEKSFEEKHPQYDIILEMTPLGAYHEKLIILLAADDPPDIFITWPDQIKRFIRGGAIMSVNDLLLDSAAMRNYLKEHETTGNTVDSTIYGIPHPVHNFFLVMSTQTTEPMLTWEFLKMMVLELPGLLPEGWESPFGDSAPETGMMPGMPLS